MLIQILSWSARRGSNRSRVAGILLPSRAGQSCGKFTACDRNPTANQVFSTEALYMHLRRGRNWTAFDGNWNHLNIYIYIYIIAFSMILSYKPQEKLQEAGVQVRPKDIVNRAKSLIASFFWHDIVADFKQCQSFLVVYVALLPVNIRWAESESTGCCRLK